MDPNNYIREDEKLVLQSLMRIMNLCDETAGLFPVMSVCDKLKSEIARSIGDRVICHFLEAHGNP